MHLADDAHRNRFEPEPARFNEIAYFTQGREDMSEEAEKARQALQESMDLRDQGHSDD